MLGLEKALRQGFNKPAVENLGKKAYTLIIVETTVALRTMADSSIGLPRHARLARPIRDQ